jgi:hypothetical protein
MPTGFALAIGLLEILKSRQGLVNRDYNPSYLGGRGRRSESSRPAWTKVVMRLSKSKIKTKQLNVWLK